METHKGFPCIPFLSTEELYNWLLINHAQHGSIWLILYKKNSSHPSLSYSEIVDVLLCFGWIDSLPNKRDAESHYLFVSPRSPKSNWSKVNKEKAEKLIQSGRMHEAGFQSIELAKKRGTWDALEAVDNLEIPPDLQEYLQANEEALSNFNAFSNSVRRGILEWIFNSKTKETRSKRIELTTQMAALNLKVNFPPDMKKFKEREY